jgi:hypothetical protein
MGTTEDLFIGLATRLDGAGLGRYVDDPDTVWSDGDTAIVRGKLPDEPHRAVAWRVMPAAADVASPFATFLAAAIVRGLPDDPTDASNLADAVRANLLGLTDVTFGGTHVIQIRFGGAIDLDEDASNRTMWSTKLLIDVDEAPTILRPEGGAWD